MPTTLPSMGLTLPTRGSGGAGAWGDTLDADLALLDAHDHSSGKGARITPSGININADLPFSALWAPTQLHRVQFSNVAAASLTGGMAKSLFVSDGTGGLVTNELYYRTNAGASVQITNGSALNVGSFAGTIGGDYASVGAQLNYTDSSKTYDFKESTADSHGWARLQCGGLRLIEFNTTESLFVAQIAPTALAGSYTVTWPTALPASSQSLSIDNAGQLAVGASQSLAADNSYTVSGTGRYKFGTMTASIHGSAFQAANFIGYTISGAGVTSLQTAYAPIVLPNGARILAVRAFVLDNASGPTKCQISIVSVTSTGTTATIASSAQSSGAGANQTLTVSFGAITIASGTIYALAFASLSGGAACTIYGAEVDYDQP